MKTKLITWLVTIGAFLDILYTFVTDNSGLLNEIGLSPKTTKIILLVGILWNAFSDKLGLKLKE
jgi:hypothetical protein